MVMSSGKDSGPKGRHEALSHRAVTILDPGTTRLTIPFMPAYAIFIRERTTDPAELAIYSEKVGSTTAGHPLTIRAYYGPQEVLEGPPAEGVVLLEFPTMAEAKAWFTSPAYQEARVHRLRGAEYRVIFVEGVAPGS